MITMIIPLLKARELGKEALRAAAQSVIVAMFVPSYYALPPIWKIIMQHVSCAACGALGLFCK